MELRLWWYRNVERNPIISKVVDYTKSAWAGIISFFEVKENDVDAGTYLSNRIGIIYSVISDAWNSVKGQFETLRSNSVVIDTAFTFVESAWAGIISFFDPTENDTDVGTYIANRINASVEAIKKAWKVGVEWFTGKNAKSRLALAEEDNNPAGIEHWQKEYDKTLPGIIDSLREQYPLLNTVATGFEAAWNLLFSVIEDVYNKVSSMFVKNKETGLSPIEEFLQHLGDFHPITDWFDEFSTKLSSGWTTLKMAFNEVANQGGVFGWIRTILGDFAESFKHFDLTSFLENSNTLMTAGLFAFALTKIANVFGGWTNVFKNIISFASKGNFTFFKTKQDSIGKTLLYAGLGVLSIGVSVMMVTSAINQMLHMIESAKEEGKSDSLEEAIQHIFDIFKTLAGLKLLDTVGAFGNGDKSFKLGAALSVAMAVWILVSAVKSMYDTTKNFSDAEWEQFNKTLEKVGILVGAFAVLDTAVTVASNFSRTGNASGLSAAAGVVAVAFAVQMIVNAAQDLYNTVKDFTDPQWDKLDKVLDRIRGFALIFAGLDAVVTLASDFQQLPGVGTMSGAAGVVAVAFAVQMIVDTAKGLYDTVKDFDDDQWNTLDKALDRIKGFVKIFALLDAATTVASSFTRGGILNGIGSAGGVVAVAYAVQMIIDAAKDLYDKAKDFTDDDWTIFDMMLGRLQSLVGLFGAFSILKEVPEIFSGWHGAAAIAANALEIWAFGSMIKKIVKAFASAFVTIQESGISIDKMDKFMGYINAIESVINICSTVSEGIRAASNIGVSAATGKAVGGIASFVEGVSSVASGAGSYISSLGVVELINSFADALVSIKDVSPETIKTYGDYINGIVSVLSVFNTILGTLVGLQNLIAGLGISAFTSALSSLFSTLFFGGSQIAQFYTDTQSINADDLRKIGTGIAGLAEELATGKRYYTDAADVLMTLGPALSLYYGHIGGIKFTEDGPADAETIRKAFQTLAEAMTDENGDILYIAGFSRSGQDGDNLDDFALGIANIAEALRKYGEEVGGISVTKVAAANNILNTISNLKINKTGSMFRIITGEASLNTFADNIGKLGNGVKNFASAFTGENEGILDSIDMDKALAPLLAIGEVGSKLPTTGGIFEWLTGEHNLADWGSKLESFATSVVNFANTVNGANFDIDVEGSDNDAILDALEVLDKVVGYGVSLGSLETGLTNFDALRESLLGFFTGLNAQLGNMSTAYGTGQGVIDYSDAVISAITGISAAFLDNIDMVAEAIIEIINSAGIKVDSPTTYASFVNVGENIDLGIAQGIYNKFSAVTAAAYAVALAAYASALAALLISSPSRKFAWIGEMSDRGLAEGLLGYARVVESASGEVAEAALNGYENKLLDTIDDTPVIRPVLDLSDVSSGISTMNGMFGNYGVGVTSTGIADRIASEAELASSRLAVGSSDVGLGNAVDRLNDRVDELGYAISHMQVVTETGAIIGAIRTGMDVALGEEEFYSSRGI